MICKVSLSQGGKVFPPRIPVITLGPSYVKITCTNLVTAKQNTDRHSYAGPTACMAAAQTHLDWDTWNSLLHLKKNQITSHWSQFTEWEHGLKDISPEEGKCDKEMSYCGYDWRSEGGKATLGYTQLVIIILPALPRSQPSAFHQEEEKQNEILTLNNKGTGTTVSNCHGEPAAQTLEVQ